MGKILVENSTVLQRKSHDIRKGEDCVGSENPFTFYENECKCSIRYEHSRIIAIGFFVTSRGEFDPVRISKYSSTQYSSRFPNLCYSLFTC